MDYTILFFANIKDLTGTSKTTLSLPENTSVAEFKKILSSSFPVIEGFMENLLISVNQEFVFNEDIIPQEAEIAVFPPVSGGNGDRDILRITTESINIDKLLSEVTRNTTGAAAIFTGIIRGETSRGNQFKTVALEYESYVPMAEKKMVQVAAEIRAQWDSIENIVIVQRIGLMDAGIPTVVVICTAAHRDTGVFDAAKYGIDRLKEIVPIWKKEIGPNGETWIEGDYLPTKGD